MTRKQRLDELREAGYMAGLNSQLCEAPTRKELERAAWEIGWRAGKSDLEKAVQRLEETKGEYRSMVIRMENGDVVNTDKAQLAWQERRFHDGRNFISKATGTQFEHETLYKSRRGRYYVVRTSDYQGTHERAEWVSEEQAARWMLVNEHDLPEDLERLRDTVEE